MISDWYYCKNCGPVEWEWVDFCSLDAYAEPGDHDAFCSKCGGEAYEMTENDEFFCKNCGLLSDDDIEFGNLPDYDHRDVAFCSKCEEMVVRLDKSPKVDVE